jgi:hypothetical protein
MYTKVAVTQHHSVITDTHSDTHSDTCFGC